jgi:hypothetical protein
VLGRSGNRFLTDWSLWKVLRKEEEPRSWDKGLTRQEEQREGVNPGGRRGE